MHVLESPEAFCEAVEREMESWLSRYIKDAQRTLCEKESIIWLFLRSGTSVWEMEEEWPGRY